MLTKDEKNYLAKIDSKKEVAIYPFDPRGKELGESVVSKIKDNFPDLEVVFMGSAALGIAGQKDIDIYVLADPKDFSKYLPTFRKLFGEPAKQGKHVKKSYIEWKFKKDGYEIEVYLTEPPKRQIKVFEILKSNKKLLKEYEDLKLSFDGKSYQDYQRAKYEFYNRILGFDLVSKGYNKIAQEYSLIRGHFKNLKYLKKLSSLLKPNSTILDIGCGSGKPIDEFFVNQGHKIIGLDISPKQIELARKNVPLGKFKVKDLSELKEKEFKVDAVVSFYTIFHIPREKHENLFKIINSFLPSNGLILVTIGASKWERVEDFHGTKMFWSHFGPEKNRGIIRKAGFNIVLDEIDTSGGEKHQIILARKNLEI